MHPDGEACRELSCQTRNRQSKRSSLPMARLRCNAYRSGAWHGVFRNPDGDVGQRNAGGRGRLVEKPHGNVSFVLKSLSPAPVRMRHLAGTSKEGRPFAPSLPLPTVLASAIFSFSSSPLACFVFESPTPRPADDDQRNGIESGFQSAQKLCAPFDVTVDNQSIDF